MFDEDVIFDGDTSRRVYSLARNLRDTMKLENNVWENFCQKEKKKDVAAAKKRNFDTHPNALESPTSNLSLLELHLNENFTRAESAPDSEDSELKELNNNVMQMQKWRAMSGVKSKPQLKIKKKSAPVVISKAQYSGTDSEAEEPEKLRVEKKPVVAKCRKITSQVNKNAQREMGEKKLKSCVEKILMSIDEIKILMDTGTAAPDGAEDMARRKKRASEFSGRFSRIYLYQLGRHVNELQKMSKPTTGRGSNRNVGSDSLQKLINAHQVILQGFQAYQNHLPTSVPMGVPDKLREMVQESISLCDIHRNLINCDLATVGRREEMINTFESHCKKLLEKLKENCMVSEASLLSHTSKLSLLDYKKNGNQEPYHKRKLQSRLSMYTAPVLYKKEVFWKKALAVLAKKKFNVPSRYKTATLKHRPQPATKFTNVTKSPSRPKLGSEIIKSCKLRSNYNDDIATMVQMQSDKEGPEVEVEGKTKAMCDIKNDILKPLGKGLFEQFCEENKDMTQKDFEKILQKLLGLVQCNDQSDGPPVMEEDARAILEKKMGCVIDSMSGTDFIERLMSTIDQEGAQNEDVKKNEKPKETVKVQDLKKQPEKRKQTVTVSGAKNAQLICIRDEDSIVEHTDDQKPKKAPVVFSSTLTELLNTASSIDIKSDNELTSKANIKISRLPKKPLKNLESLANQYALTIIQYKLDYHKHNKKNHMYRKTASIQPWTLTSKIADNILENLLLSVTREIEINEILDNLYQSEFQ